MDTDNKHKCTPDAIEQELQTLTQSLSQLGIPQNAAQQQQPPSFVEDWMAMTGESEVFSTEYYRTEMTRLGVQIAAGDVDEETHMRYTALRCIIKEAKQEKQSLHASVPNPNNFGEEGGVRSDAAGSSKAMSTPALPAFSGSADDDVVCCEIQGDLAAQDSGSKGEGEDNRGTSSSTSTSRSSNMLSHVTQDGRHVQQGSVIEHPNEQSSWGDLTAEGRKHWLQTVTAAPTEDWWMFSSTAVTDSIRQDLREFEFKRQLVGMWTPQLTESHQGVMPDISTYKDILFTKQIALLRAKTQASAAVRIQVRKLQSEARASKPPVPPAPQPYPDFPEDLD